MKQILLTQGKVALVDDDIYEEVSQFKWFANKKGNTYYAMRWADRKGDSSRKRSLIYLHFVIIGKPSKRFEILHKDGNGLNNQRDNLRFGTHRENMQERIEHRNGKLVGCHYHKGARKWLAKIHIDGKRIYLGLFSTEQEAHEAYLKALQ